jgi:hypothetical protein
MCSFFCLLAEPLPKTERMKYFTVDSYVFRECAEGHEKDSHVSDMFNYMVEHICDPSLSTICQILGWMDLEF